MIYIMYPHTKCKVLWKILIVKNARLIIRLIKRLINAFITVHQEEASAPVCHFSIYTNKSVSV